MSGYQHAYLATEATVPSPAPTMPNPADLITFRRAGALLGVTHPTIRRWISEQRLSEYRIANSPRVDRREVLGLISLVSAAQAVIRR